MSCRVCLRVVACILKKRFLVQDQTYGWYERISTLCGDRVIADGHKEEVDPTSDFNEFRGNDSVIVYTVVVHLF